MFLRGPFCVSVRGEVCLCESERRLGSGAGGRGHGRLVIDQPATEADQDRGTCGPPRPRHHLPTGRSRRHRHDGARHPRRHPPIASASAMRMTAIHAQTERKRQDRSARCAENHHRRDTTRRLRGPICPAPQACAFANTSQGEKRLSSCRIQAIFMSPPPHLGNVGLHHCSLSRFQGLRIADVMPEATPPAT